MIGGMDMGIYTNREIFMNEDEIIEFQKRELKNLIKQHQASCPICHNNFLCNQAIEIINEYMVDQEQQGN